MIVVRGIGWLNDREFGSVRRRDRRSHDASGRLEDLWKKHDILDSPGKNFRRFDRRSKITCYACSLALRDAGFFPRESGENVGIVATGRLGCLESNELYFRDYLESGRALARGNLFVYTLPTSAVSEAAILFGLQGPTLYLTGPEKGFSAAIKRAAGTIARKEADAMVVVSVHRREALALVLASTPADNVYCHIEQAITLIEETRDLSESITGLYSLFDKKDMV
jgi:3-oxoacyl-(acyl-carrier-protein) synthase